MPAGGVTDSREDRPIREWRIGRSEGGWHAIYDTSSIVRAKAFEIGRARIIVAALAAEHDEPVREQSDDDLCDPMFTEAMRSLELPSVS